MKGAEIFADDAAALAIYDAIAAEIAVLPGAQTQVSASQVGFFRAHPFAAAWMPKPDLRRDAPVVLAVYLRDRVESSRWKQVTETAPGRFSHHLELDHPDEVDETVARWLRQAWGEAG